MKHSPLRYFFVLMMICFTTEAVKKRLMDIINVCKRNDPEFSKCFCTNVNNVIPKLKDGVPEMNIMPIDPAYVESVKMDLTQTQSVKFKANLQNVTIYGMNKGYVQQCDAFHNSDGTQVSTIFYLPEVVLRSLYNATGNLLLVAIDTAGDLYLKHTNMTLKVVWNSTRHGIKDKEYLLYNVNIENMVIEKMYIHFNNVFGNNTEMNERINDIINENIRMLYYDIEPVLLDTMGAILQKIANDFHEAFSYDLLYPKE